MQVKRLIYTLYTTLVKNKLYIIHTCSVGLVMLYINIIILILSSIAICVLLTNKYFFFKIVTYVIYSSNSYHNKKRCIFYSLNNGWRIIDRCVIDQIYQLIKKMNSCLYYNKYRKHSNLISIKFFFFVVEFKLNLFLIKLFIAKVLIQKACEL